LITGLETDDSRPMDFTVRAWEIMQRDVDDIEEASG